MAQSITITFDSDSEATNFLTNFCIGAGYQNEVLNPNFDRAIVESKTNSRMIDNPVSHKLFWKEKVIQWSRVVASEGEGRVAKTTGLDKFNKMSIN